VVDNESWRVETLTPAAATVNSRIFCSQQVLLAPLDILYKLQWNIQQRKGTSLHFSRDTFNLVKENKRTPFQNGHSLIENSTAN